MKAMTANNINNLGLEASKRTLINRNISAREVVLMNLISNIMINDKDIKNAKVESKRANKSHDHGFHIYKILEFGRGDSKNISHNQHMELMCNRLI